jgi:hypothetical protein
MDTTIFSKATKKTHFNFALGAALTTIGGSGLTDVLANACFGDAKCQENRALLTQTSLTNAQANLAATQVAAIEAQNSGEQNKLLLYVGIGFGIVVIVLGAIFLLKKS